MLVQGWFRFSKSLNDTQDLINRGHSRTLPTDIDVMIEYDNLSISGTISMTMECISGWNNILLTIRSNDNHDEWVIGARIFPIGEGRILIRFNDSDKQYRIIIHNHDEKYDKFKMQIGNKTIAFRKPVIRGKIVSPISGKVTSVFMKPSHISGDSIIEIESMKMIFPVKVVISGEYHVSVLVGDTIREDDVIAVLSEDEHHEPEQGTIASNWNIENLIHRLPPWMYSSTSNQEQCISKSVKSKKQINRNPPCSELQSILTQFANSMIYRLSVKFDPTDEVWCDRCWQSDTLHTVNDSELFQSETRQTGIAGFFIDGQSPCIVIGHHPTFNHASIGVNESVSFLSASRFARMRKIPRVYVCRTSGASLEYNVAIMKDIKSNDNGNGVWTHRMLGCDVKKWQDTVVIDSMESIDSLSDDSFYRIVKITGTAVDTLNACAVIASETSLAYQEIPTYTYVRDYAVGIGAYLARLGHRVIQRRVNDHYYLPDTGRSINFSEKIYMNRTTNWVGMMLWELMELRIIW